MTAVKSLICVIVETDVRVEWNVSIKSGRQEHRKELAVGYAITRRTGKETDGL